MNRGQSLGGVAAGAPLLDAPHFARPQHAIMLNGASQVNDAFFICALVRFEQLAKQYHAPGPVNFVLHRNSALGQEEQQFESMSAGRGALDYAMVSPAHMSAFGRAAPLVDAPFLSRDPAQWNKVLDADPSGPVAQEIERRARVALIGYAGGGVRNIFANRRITNMAELRGLKVRVQDAPIWSRSFRAPGMAPTVIACNKVCNGIQNNVMEAGENEAAGVEAMRSYGAAPNRIMTQHAVTIRLGAAAGRDRSRRARGRKHRGGPEARRTGACGAAAPDRVHGAGRAEARGRSGDARPCARGGRGVHLHPHQCADLTLRLGPGPFGCRPGILPHAQ